MATGGQNRLFGKTTGSLLCDGYAAGKLFRQGAKLKTLEFIQYHPTTMETPEKERPDFQSYISGQQQKIEKHLSSVSKFSAVYIMQDLAKIMNDNLGITRTGDKLKQGIESMDYYLSISDKLIYDSEISPYQGYSLKGMFTLARAILTCAEKRQANTESTPYWQVFRYDASPDTTVAALLDALYYTDDLYDIEGNAAPRIRWECSYMQNFCGRAP